MGDDDDDLIKRIGFLVFFSSFFLSFFNGERVLYPFSF